MISFSFLLSRSLILCRGFSPSHSHTLTLTLIHTNTHTHTHTHTQLVIDLIPAECGHVEAAKGVLFVSVDKATYKETSALDVMVCVVCV